MKNGDVFETDLARKSIGFVCDLGEHLQGWFCHIFSGVLDSEIQGDVVADDTSATTGCWIANPAQQVLSARSYKKELISISSIFIFG